MARTEFWMDAIYARMAAGTATYEDAADLFMNTITGRSTRVSREEFLVRLRRQYPTPQSLADLMRRMADAVAPLYHVRNSPDTEH